jgi:hypothetical protein
MDARRRVHLDDHLGQRPLELVVVLDSGREGVRNHDRFGRVLHRQRDARAFFHQSLQLRHSVQDAFGSPCGAFPPASLLGHMGVAQLFPEQQAP